MSLNNEKKKVVMSDWIKIKDEKNNFKISHKTYNILDNYRITNQIEHNKNFGIPELVPNYTLTILLHK